jgi:hypothetical protein
MPYLSRWHGVLLASDRKMSAEEFFGRHLLAKPRQFRLSFPISTEKVTAWRWPPFLPADRGA